MCLVLAEALRECRAQGSRDECLAISLRVSNSVMQAIHDGNFGTGEMAALGDGGSIGPGAGAIAGATAGALAGLAFLTVAVMYVWRMRNLHIRHCKAQWAAVQRGWGGTGNADALVSSIGSLGMRGMEATPTTGHRGSTDKGGASPAGWATHESLTNALLRTMGPSRMAAQVLSLSASETAGAVLRPRTRHGHGVGGRNTRVRAAGAPMGERGGEAGAEQITAEEVAQDAGYDPCTREPAQLAGGDKPRPANGQGPVPLDALAQTATPLADDVGKEDCVVSCRYRRAASESRLHRSSRKCGTTSPHLARSASACDVPADWDPCRALQFMLELAGKRAAADSVADSGAGAGSLDRVGPQHDSHPHSNASCASVPAPSCPAAEPARESSGGSGGAMDAPAGVSKATLSEKAAGAYSEQRPAARSEERAPTASAQVQSPGHPLLVRIWCINPCGEVPSTLVAVCWA